MAKNMGTRAGKGVRCLVVLLFFACATKGTTTMGTKRMETTELIEALEQQPGTRVTVGGAAGKAPWSRAGCVYWEWVAGEPDGDELASIEDQNHLGDVLELQLEGGMAKVHLNSIRLHQKPSFDQTFARAEDVKPGKLAGDIPEDSYPLRVVEHCLSAGTELYTHVEAVDLPMPPAGPGESAETKTQRILHLSEAPFEDGKTSVEMTARSGGLSF